MAAFLAGALLSPAPATLADDALGLKNFREINASLEAVTGISSRDPDIQAIYRQVVSRLPLRGAVEEMSSPTVLAMTELSGVYCAKFVATEAAVDRTARRAFRALDFRTGATQLTAATRTMLFADLADRFWGREPTDAEIAALNTTVDETVAGTGAAASTLRLAHVLCVVYATSLGFLIQ